MVLEVGWIAGVVESLAMADEHVGVSIDRCIPGEAPGHLHAPAQIVTHHAVGDADVLEPGMGPRYENTEDAEAPGLHIRDAKPSQPLPVGKRVVAPDAIAGVVRAPSAHHDEILDGDASRIFDGDAGLPPGQDGGPPLAKRTNDN